MSNLSRPTSQSSRETVHSGQHRIVPASETVVRKGFNQHVQLHLHKHEQQATDEVTTADTGAGFLDAEDGAKGGAVVPTNVLDRPIEAKRRLLGVLDLQLYGHRQRERKGSLISDNAPSRSRQGLDRC